MRIYPAPGLLVRDPVKKDFLPVTGREVPDGGSYWTRRLSCGDATLTGPEEQVSSTPKPESRPASGKAEKPKTIEGSDSQ
ncbi:DUF2635 domain-containing protein [Pseudomonas chlororaphis]|uniref:DUF2635 domain-containing protein n=1 Tax=Pseudomonas chlororaphis TaxID=587753 RepID=UPI00209AE2F5|nr:DUF2635 domain-containing protein [Pseudomonas chlororaphis]MCO7569371.1 DUF2635 domain-containing protein [Pseudomonas chlororaphis]MCO7586784.1 DUF2635 domain-containing protein [Pseudomonas chlororaphis]